MKFQIIFIVILALAAGKTAGEVFAELAKTNNWGEGVSSNLCYNMDYVIRLQHTVDYPDIHNIVELGFGDWSMASEIYLTNKKYIGIQLGEGLRQSLVPADIEVKTVKDLREVTDSGDLLVVKDVLMYYPNADIDYFMTTILPRFKYALIHFSAVDSPHADTVLGKYRPLMLSFPNARKVTSMQYKSTRKQTWLLTRK